MGYRMSGMVWKPETFFHILLVLTLISPTGLSAQPEIKLPGELNIHINKNLYEPTTGWLDTLVDQARNYRIKYEIVNSTQTNALVTTKIRIPQVLPLSSVLQQIILYYAILSDEDSKEKELLQIYPYFSPLQLAPAINCVYSSSKGYMISVDSWKPVPVPPAPGPVEKFIHNQVIEKALANPDIIDDIPDEIFQAVARENNRTVAEVRSIYENVRFWLKAGP